MKLCCKLVLLSVFVLPGLASLPAAPARAAKPAPKAQASMHKCTDASGRVYYTDSPDAGCGQGQALNRHGVKVDRPPQAPAAAAPAQAEQTTAAAVARSRRDKAILATYTEESQIVEAKARNLEPPLQAVRLGNRQLERARAHRDTLKQQADALAKQQRPLPPTLAEDLQRREGEVARLESDVARKQAHADEIAARYDEDLRRYRELTGAPAPR